MPCISGLLTPRKQAIVEVGISGVQSDGDDKQIFKNYAALIDTGASCTCITDKVVGEIGLKPTGKASMQSASHVEDRNIFIVDFAFPFGGAVFMRQGMQVMEFSSFENDFEILLGMDVITGGSLTISFDNHFVFCL